MTSISLINFDIRLTPTSTASETGAALLGFNNGGGLLYWNEGGAELARVVSGNDRAAATFDLDVAPGSTPLVFANGDFAFASSSGSAINYSYFNSDGLGIGGNDVSLGSSVSHFVAASVGNEVAISFVDGDGTEAALLDYSGRFIQNVDTLELNNGSGISSHDSAGHDWDVLAGGAIGNGAFGVLTLTGSTISLHSINLASFSDTGRPVTVATAPNLVAGSVTYTALSSGGALLSWRDGNSFDVKTVDAGGNTTATFAPITPNQAGSFEVIPVTGGGYLAVWDDGDDGLSEIFGQLYDPTGNAASSVYLLNQDISNAHSGPSAVQLSSGDILVSWTDTSSSGSVINGRLLSLTRPEATDQHARVTVDSSAHFSPLFHDTDPGNTALAVSSLGTAAHGTVTLSGNEITYTPYQGYSGSDGFNYTVTDANGLTDTARIFVNITAPSVAGDLSGDGRSDILFRNDDGSLSTWHFTTAGDATSGDTVQENTFFTGVPASWHAQETFDMNGDGSADLLWRNDDGRLSVWNATADGFQQGSYNDYVTTDWKIAATGDINGDGKDDILFRNDNGSLSTWTSTGPGFVENSYYHASIGTDWKVAGMGDFNGDGTADILFRNDNGTVSLWSSTGTGFTENTFFQPVTTDWHIAGVGDFNGDGKADILWRNDNGAVTVWQSTGNGFVEGAINATVSTDWHVVQVGDFNADGKADILFRNDNGALSAWHSDGANFVEDTFYDTSVPTNWHVDAHQFEAAAFLG